MNLRRAALIGALSIVFAGAASAQHRDSYMCYAAKSAKGICAAGQTNAGALCLDDAQCMPGGEDTCVKVGKRPKGDFARLDDTRTTSVGEDKTFEVKKAKHLCIPVDRSGDDAMQGDDITDAVTHYVSYQIKQAKKVCVGGGDDGLPCTDDEFNTDCSVDCVVVPKFDKEAIKNTGILVGDGVADVTVNAGKAVLLMAPASACQGTDATCPDPEPAPGTEDHFKCYAIKATKNVCTTPTDTNWLQACGEDLECVPSNTGCTELPKFPKGLASTVDDDGVVYPASGRAFGTGKPAYLCKAVEKTYPPDGTPEDVVNPAARMVCYKGKAGGQCSAASPGVDLDFNPCDDEVDCGGTDGVTVFCVDQLKFDKDDTDNHGFYAQDQFDGDAEDIAISHNRLNLNKEDVLCVPACEFSPLSFRATTLSIEPTGHPGDGLDVDSSGATCRPQPVSAPPNPGCSGGIDNSLGTLIAALGGFGLDLNQTLQDSIDDGSINILLNLDEFSNGTRVITGHTGELDDDNLLCDIDNPASKCDYKASCAGDIEIVLPVTISGLPGSPAAVAGGGPGTSFGLSIPALGTEINIEVRNVKVAANIVHTAGVINSATGIIAGAIIQRELKNNIAMIPDGVCGGGTESGETCPPSTCPGGGFCLDFMFTISGLIDGIPRDIDTDGLKTCEGGTNAGEACTVIGTCPDQSNFPVTDCTFLDGISVGLVFSGLDANITGVDN